MRSHMPVYTFLPHLQHWQRFRVIPSNVCDVPAVCQVQLRNEEVREPKVRAPRTLPESGEHFTNVCWGVDGRVNPDSLRPERYTKAE